MRINRWKAIGTDKGQMEENQRVSLGLQKAIELMKKKHKERSSGEFTGPTCNPKSALLRGLSIAFLSLIGTQTVPGSLQFGFRAVLRCLPYRFALSLKGPHKGSSKIQSLRWRSFTTALPKIQSSLSGALAPLYPFSLIPSLA
ncbi:hypothetical protein TNCV_3954921 [Trichonephila clavipes]|nr:hypothetical protein TNCV_3954921 [Trichonephila clavipes]